MDKYKLRKKFCWNERGALEGLPLYLIILVVITAIAIVIIVAWLGNPPKELGRIEANGPNSDGTINDNSVGPVVVKAYDTNGKPLEGVEITIEGPNNALGTGKTNRDGEATISLNKEPTLPTNQNFGDLTINARYTGQVEVRKTTSVTVINV